MNHKERFSQIIFYLLISKKLLISLIFLLFPFNAIALENKRLNSIKLDYWQTICSSPKNYKHTWIEQPKKYSIKRLSNIAENFRSGYAFSTGEKLIIRDTANKKYYEYLDGSYYPLERSIVCPKAIHEDYVIETSSNKIKACKLNDIDNCKSITIKENTYPYVITSHNDSVLAITNYGDALIFKANEWCRMSLNNEIFMCDKDAKTLEKGRGIQFYSAVDYFGTKLIGHFPTGRLYEFDGNVLKPSNISPPEFNKNSKHYEAQSMAIYCGDLFVGYWPYGEIYRLDSKTNEWSRFVRLFSHPSKNRTPLFGEPVPYSKRLFILKNVLKKFTNFRSSENEDISLAFLGQRVSALVPYNDSLYAITSNLRAWGNNVNPKEFDFLNESQINEYGAIYKIYSEGCNTVKSKID
ncbi:hypothetical protein [Prochlorococcus marinus]|uniref:Uncharacterized protein n=1 Tax=Prochlorococcus marinus str. GP2 TaxID=59925 RepID=A0A0A1ZI30_PROMR|nr:hypothetical protein [Prochlorococcus marinus]KGF89045.1 hypothetical protein EU91_0159 [Prochlorococcus marinus str. GP2]